ncbi:hypothetical protein BG841_15800 [Marinobacter sp. X15-166B]|nr:hypothetical protein BG841_15800 [Marinobacter sp. X15-166B]
MLQPKEYEIVFRDKSINYSLCQAKGIETPEIISIIPKGQALLEHVLDVMCKRALTDKLIVKPVDGKGGAGIIYIEFDSNNEVLALKGQSSINISTESSESKLIVQKFLNQDDKLNFISHSVNTVRVVTLLLPNQEVLIIGAYIRFGTGKSKIDNLSQGGICVCVLIEEGVLAKIGYDRNGTKYTNHPTSNFTFSGYNVPQWDEVIQLARRVQTEFDFYKLLGMDIAITVEGPVIVEINSNYDNVDLEQACGPILKNKKVLEAFSQYGLLINKKQKGLAGDGKTKYG